MIHRLLYLTLIIVIAQVAVYSCRSVPSGGSFFHDDQAYAPIEGIIGSEDMVLDKWHNPPRLLVSSDDRRKSLEPGSIYMVDVETNAVTSLKREGEPINLSFHPHGLDIIQTAEGKIFLYVINHSKEPRGTEHAVLKYEVFPNRLLFKEIFKHPLLVSPNDVAVHTDESIYVSNGRSDKGGMGETFFKLKRSTVVYYDRKGTWSIAADGIAMANGIAITGDTLYVAATGENTIYSWTKKQDGGLTNKEIFSKLKRPDNLTISGNNLLATSHTKPFALMAHFNNPEKKAPSLIYSINLTSGKSKPVFYDGTNINAASVGVQYRDALYIGQFFDPFILKYTGKFAFYKSTINGLVKKTH